MKIHLLFFLAIVTATRGLHAQGLPSVTFTNPKPEGYEGFGAAIAAVGADKVVIATPYHGTGGFSYVGAAYLFNTNGTFLTILNNPTPANSDYFGWSVAAVGTDKVVVGAPGDDAGGTDSGAAYLFNTSGTLLITFTNPTPANFDGFGSAVAGVGADKVLVGAYADSAGATYAGAAYLFSTNGTLLTTITNPTPANPDYFGNAVAAVATDQVLIAAYGDSTTAPSAGAAYFYTLNVTVPNPNLRIFRTATNTAVVAWPATTGGWTLQSHTNLVATNWTAATNEVNVAGSEYQVIISPPSGNKYFRLARP